MLTVGRHLPKWFLFLVIGNGNLQHANSKRQSQFDTISDSGSIFWLNHTAVHDDLNRLPLSRVERFGIVQPDGTTINPDSLVSCAA
jgi:hypothetical protein